MADFTTGVDISAQLLALMIGQVLAVAGDSERANGGGFVS